MKKTFVWLTSLAVLMFALSVVVFIFGPYINVTAQSDFDAAQPQVKQESHTSVTNQQEANLSSEVIARTENWADELQNAGWIHVVMYQKTLNSPSDVALDSSYVQKEFITEDWVLLDENGNQIQGIFLQRDLDNEIIQVSTLKDGHWYNLTYGDVIPAPSTVPYTFDFGFPEVAIRLEDNLEKSQVQIGNDSLDRYSATENYSEPIDVTGLNKKVSSLVTETFLDANGMTKIYQTTFTFEDGSSLVSSYVEIQAFEQGTLPPDEIIAYLEQGVKK
jgi:hypothetical protein